MQTTSMKIALVDDHTLFRKGLVSLIKLTNSNVDIVFEAENGFELQEKIKSHDCPDIILMDINMPDMDGFQCVLWLKKHFPLVKVLVISMIQNEESVIAMLRLDVKGYLGKDVEPKELNEALNSVFHKGYYYTDFVTGKLIHSLQNPEKDDHRKNLNDRELTFLKLACSELTYNEIATTMCLSPKTIDGYRNTLFEKLMVKSRVGLVLYSIRTGIVRVS